MKAWIALLFAATLAVVPLVSTEADASTGLIGEGSSDTMSVSYYESGNGIAVVTMAETPSARTVGLLVIGSQGDYQRVPILPSAKVIAVEIQRLSVDVYTFIVTDGQTQTPIAECDVSVHEQSGPTYVVTFSPNGGSGTMAPILVTDGKAVLPECTFDGPDGKKFQEWSAGGAKYSPGSTIQVSSDITVSAVWGESSGGGGIPLTYIAVGAAVAIVAAFCAMAVLRGRSRRNHFRGHRPRYPTQSHYTGASTAPITELTEKKVWKWTAN